MAILLDGTLGITTPGLTNTGTETIVNLTTTGNTILGDASTDTLNVGNGGLVKDASGNVGIGIASPKGVLDVTSAGAYVPVLLTTTNTASSAQRNWMISTSWNLIGDLSFVTSNAIGGNPVSAGTTRMMIDASGNVGIGTSSPNVGGFTRALSLNRTSPSNGSCGIDFLNAGTAEGYIFSDGSVSALIIQAAGSNTYSLNFKTGGSERARIDSSGNLLVGGTTLNESFSGIPTIQGSTNCIFTNKRSSTSSSSQFRFYNPNGLVGDISTSGSATTYGTSSDYRLKENIAPMTGALSVVQQLKPVTYNWKVDGSDGQGFIAHELQAVVPDCVVGEKDAVETYTDEDGNEQTRPVYQSIDTSFLVATLTAAIQEQQALIQQLQADVAALKGSTPA